MTISILQPQRPQPANDGHVRDNLTADERLLKQAVARCLKAQLAEVHGRLVGGAVEKGGPGSGSWDGPGQPRFAKAGEVPIPVSEFDKGMREKEFVMPKRAKQNDAELVWVDVKKFEEGFKKNDSQYIGEGGTGGISNRYSSFAEYYKANKEIEVSEVVISKGTWDEKGTVQFINGRHRYAYMRDQGATTIPVALFLSPDTMELSEARKEGIVKEFNLKFTFSIKGGPASAVPSSTKPWDDMVMREVRPIWFGLFKKGGDKALQNIRRFPKHARKMAVLSWAEMEVSERVAVKEFMGVMRRSSEKIAGDLGSQELPAPTSLKASPSIVIPEWIEDPDVLDALEREMFKFAHGINQTTADDLRAELMAGMENGETIPQLADRISGLSDEWVEGWRSEMIARTETARAFSTGHIEAWRSTGVVDRKVWVAAGDSCPFCQQMDGTVVELDENFFDQGDEQATNWKGQEVVMGHDYSDVNGPPLHPNCYLHHTVMVTTDAGKKMISKIKVGDRVLTARGRFRPVTRILEKTGHYKGRAVRIMYRGWKDWGFTNQNSVTTTPEHPFLTDGGWKAAQDVTPNDSLYVLASYCLACGKKIPFWRKYCSDECVYVDQPEIGEKISEIKKQRNWMKGRTGALHHSWRGGKIWWRGKDWDVLKRKIVERDGFMCQDCGMMEEACLEKSGQPLHVHHLNPYRDSFDNSPQNLITLCVSCHAKREGTVNSRFLKRGGVSFIDTPVLAVQHIDNFKGERLYNFSVAEDESYVAQGIVNHNCRCVLVAELDEEKAIKKGLPIL